MGRIPRGRVFGGDAPDVYEEWIQVTSGTAEDPGGLTSAQTLTSGTYAVTMTAVATVVDGYQENTPRWHTPLLTWLPDFDPTIDTLEQQIRITSMPATGTRLGIYCAILDSETLGSANGTGLGVDDLSVSAHTMSEIEKATLVGASFTVRADRIVCRTMWDTSRTVVLIGLGRNSGNWIYDRQGTGVSDMGATLANWRLVTGVYRQGGSSGGDLSWTYHVRRIRGVAW